MTDFNTAGELPAKRVRPIKHSWARNHKELEPQQCEQPTFEAFAQWILDNPGEHKGDGMICAPLNLQGERTREHDPKNPGGFRNTRNVQPRRFIALDADNATPEDLERVKRTLAVWSALLYTTASHTEETPCFRVVIELDREIDRQEGIALGPVIEQHLCPGTFWDKSTHRGEQPVYLPVADQFLHTRFQGPPLKVDSFLESASTSSSPPQAPRPTQAIERLFEGEGLHDHAVDLVWHLSKLGVSDHLLRQIFLGFRSGLEDLHGTDRVQKFYNGELERIILGAQFRRDESGQSIIRDPFASLPSPPLSPDLFAVPFAEYAQAFAVSNGFDAGAVLFCLLICAANTGDMRTRIKAGSFEQPAQLWGSLAGPSGEGKTPTMGAAMRFVRALEEKRDASNKRAFDTYKDFQDSDQEGDVPAKPVWKQKLIDDATTEAMARIWGSNPEGLFLFHDELTAIIGRMDAYTGADKDRPVFLHAYDGGRATINRARSDIPIVIPNSSLGILAGVQPEVLASLQSKGKGSAADGLYQRFLHYSLPLQEDGTYEVIEQRLLDAVDAIFEKLDKELDEKTFRLSRDALVYFRDVSKRLKKNQRSAPSPRLGEHLSKFPGFMLRISLALHRIDAAAADEGPEFIVPISTVERAARILETLMRHSQAIYAVLDDKGGEHIHLAQTAAEAILAKPWGREETFKRGDLTRDATHWQKAEERHAQAALGLLEDWGWIADATPPREPGKRGRPSAGVFRVNHDVHTRFSEFAQGVKDRRIADFASIQANVGSR